MAVLDYQSPRLFGELACFGSRGKEVVDMIAVWRFSDLRIPRRIGKVNRFSNVVCSPPRGKWVFVESAVRVINHGLVMHCGLLLEDLSRHYALR